MADREKVIKALSICVPETQDDSKLECSDCPYGDVCNPNDIVGITLPLIWDIRELLKEQGVKHGEWISIWEEDNPDTSNHARCSVCNRISKRPAGEYCKRCGAKMDLEGR